MTPLLLLLACDGAPKDVAPPDSAIDSDTSADTDTSADPDTDPDTSSDPDTPQLWLYVSSNLQVDENVTATDALLDRAAAAGYTGMVLADFKLNLLHTGILPEWYAPNLASVLDHAASLGIEVVPAIFPFGYSEGIYYGAPDLAEGRPVVGSRFCASGGTLVLDPVDSGLRDGGFEAHSGDSFTSWTWQDDRIAADTTNVHGGAAAVRIGAGSDNARVVQTVTVTPHRQYHLSWWMRTEAWSGYAQVILLDTTTGQVRNYNSLSPASTQGWTRYDVAFDSGDTTTAGVYLGVWGSSSGTAWFDDVTLEETALVNLIRRDGAPLVITGEDGTVYAEGSDVDPVSDPRIATTFDDWHTPPTITLPARSRIGDGTCVTVDHYVVHPIAGYQVGACLSEPAVDDWMDNNLAAVSAAFPDAAGFMLGYDEMRHMNTCARCAARGLDAGELLADHVSASLARLDATRPGATPYVWSDMFDPNHNAHADYYLVEGDIAGSWEGLSPDTVVMNWNRGNTDSLAFFAGRGHAQIIAGYYDAGDGAAAAAWEVEAAAGVEGVRGLMYTTWYDDWSQLESYAEGARAAWAAR